ncbi:hypothetical protein WG68_08445 [Arsukibacterium ikkense]|uniref:Uncharacterized protein n=1 Tax=Arsukibacterium ikkense TaxID=336831 RepID=A0A0M2V4G8_9GAMM|nr:hypothetical protein WG68_08445 [Arsukibacterium ikkense]
MFFNRASKLICPDFFYNYVANIGALPALMQPIGLNSEQITATATRWLLSFNQASCDTNAGN